jgi:hypothetical protein
MTLHAPTRAKGMSAIVQGLEDPTNTEYSLSIQFRHSKRELPSLGRLIQPPGLGRKRSIASPPPLTLLVLIPLPLLPADEHETRLTLNELRVSGLMYSNASASNCCSMPSDSGLRSGLRQGASKVYLQTTKRMSEAQRERLSQKRHVEDSYG